MGGGLDNHTKYSKENNQQKHTPVSYTIYFDSSNHDYCK